MTSGSPLSIVREIMAEFARQTGLSPRGKPHRYLWTDAFAVCNFLELHRQTGEEKYMKLALLLVDQVHRVLGRHREDDPRTGWISGLGEREGEEHPTRGGLRIGKELFERAPGEPYDELLEWMRDGQYYHYLTKWMHALNKVSQATGNPIYNRWAIELAKTAHNAFTYEISPGGRKRMYWKMSIDLSRPLVHSMGAQDPLEGLVVYHELQRNASEGPEWPSLESEITDMAEICEGMEWITDDPLGIGELLCNAFKMTRLVLAGYFKHPRFLSIVLESAEKGLEAYSKSKSLELPADARLPFRELGMSIGLKGVEKLRTIFADNPVLHEKYLLSPRIAGLLKYAQLGEEIRGFWLKKENRETDAWVEHGDINMVMLATSLAPDQYLEI